MPCPHINCLGFVPGFMVEVIADDVRSQLAEASQLTGAMRLYDSACHSELDWWTASFATSHGIPPGSLVSASESDRVDISRNFPVTPRQGHRAETSSAR